MAIFDNIDTFKELRDAITASNHDGEADTLNLASDITLTETLPPIKEDRGLTIHGNGYELNGGDVQRILFVKSGTVLLDHLTLSHGLAQGTSPGGGGGAGMGGALFIYGGSVMISDSTFEDNRAVGGDGGKHGPGGGLGLGGVDGATGWTGVKPGKNGGPGGAGGWGGAGGSGGNGVGSGWDYDYGGNSADGDGGAGGPGGFGGGGGMGGYASGNPWTSTSGYTGGKGGDGGFGGGGGSGGQLYGDGGAGGFGGGGSLGGDDMHGFPGASGPGGYGGGSGFFSGGGGAGMGGAIFVRSGYLDLVDVSFSRNSAIAGKDASYGYQAPLGLGGAVFAMAATFNSNGNNSGMPKVLPIVRMHEVTFADNHAANAGGQVTPDPTSGGTVLNNDDLFGSTFSNGPATQEGSNVADNLRGDPGWFNALRGNDGNDVLIGGKYADALDGGSGGDQFRGGLGDDKIDGGPGLDSVHERGDVDFVLTNNQLAGMGTDTLSDIECAMLTGGPGANRLDASGFAGRFVVLEGGDGDDALIGRPTNDRVKAVGDVDFVLTDDTLVGLGTDQLVAIDQALLVGGAGDNWLDASGFTRGKAMLYGGAGSDALLGSAQDDVLSGGAGMDSLRGGAGADTFIIATAEGGADQIDDFLSGIDRLLLRDGLKGLGLGNQDHAIDGGTVTDRGGFSPASELVVVASAISGSIDAISSAAAIGSATSAYAIGDARLFAVTNGADSALWLFHSSGADAQVEASELALLGVLHGAAQTTLADYGFA